MEVRITDCLKATGQRVNFDETAPFKFDDDELQELGPVHLHGHVDGLGADRVLATVQAECELTLYCSRCNQPFRHATMFGFEEIFAKNPDEDQFSEDPSFPIIDDCMIELAEAFRQNCAGQIPLQAVCKPDCQVPPELDPKLPDSRWAALAALKKKS